MLTCSFFFNDTATTEIYTLSLHDALPISMGAGSPRSGSRSWSCGICSTSVRKTANWSITRSEEHTSELQSRQYLVCRLLLEKKKKRTSPWILLTLEQTPHTPRDSDNYFTS